MHIFCTYTQKWMQRGKEDSKNKTKRLRGDTDIHSTSFISLFMCYLLFVPRAMAKFLQGGAAEA
jgi:hypothetical protein